MTGDYLGLMTSLTKHVCRSAVPVYSHAVLRWNDRRSLTSSRLYVPLGNEAQGVTQILGVQNFSGGMSLTPDPAALLCNVDKVEELLRQDVPL